MRLDHQTRHQLSHIVLSSDTLKYPKLAGRHIKGQFNYKVYRPVSSGFEFAIETPNREHALRVFQALPGSYVQMFCSLAGKCLGEQGRATPELIATIEQIRGFVEIAERNVLQHHPDHPAAPWHKAQLDKFERMLAALEPGAYLPSEYEVRG